LKAKEYRLDYIYLDNATITKLHKEVINKMMTIIENKYALATSQFSHTMGLESKEAYEEARNVIARSIGAESENIIFTSGSTESNNLAIKGYAKASKGGNHLITTSVSERSVLNSMKTLKKEGFDITVLTVDSSGRIKPEELEKVINANTILISFEHPL
jgi:cysteine desulfurase